MREFPATKAFKLSFGPARKLVLNLHYRTVVMSDRLRIIVRWRALRLFVRGVCEFRIPKDCRRGCESHPYSPVRGSNWNRRGATEKKMKCLNMMRRALFAIAALLLPATMHAQIPVDG